MGAKEFSFLCTFEGAQVRDFRYLFFTIINPIWIGDLGLEKKMIYIHIWADRRHYVSYAHAECGLTIKVQTESVLKHLMCTLSVRSNLFSTHSACGQENCKILNFIL
jgi:hypothetical protein